MKRMLALLIVLAAVTPSQAGPIRDWIKSRRDARRPVACPTCPQQAAATTQPLFARPMFPAVAESAPVQSLRGLFGAPRQTGGCANGTCPK